MWDLDKFDGIVPEDIDAKEVKRFDELELFLNCESRNTIYDAWDVLFEPQKTSAVKVIIDKFDFPNGLEIFRETHWENGTEYENRQSAVRKIGGRGYSEERIYYFLMYNGRVVTDENYALYLIHQVSGIMLPNSLQSSLSNNQSAVVVDFPSYSMPENYYESGFWPKEQTISEAFDRALEKRLIQNQNAKTI